MVAVNSTDILITNGTVIVAKSYIIYICAYVHSFGMTSEVQYAN